LALGHQILSACPAIKAKLLTLRHQVLTSGDPVRLNLLALGHAVLHMFDPVRPQLLAIRHAVLSLHPIGPDLLALGDAGLDAFGARRTHGRPLGAAIDNIGAGGLSIDTSHSGLPLHPWRRETLRAFHTWCGETLRPFHAWRSETLRALHAWCGETLHALHTRSGLNALRTLPTALMGHCGSVTAPVAATRAGASRGGNRQRGNAGGEKYPGHTLSPSERLNGP